MDPALLRVTVFAEGLNYPVGMAALDDGSLLAAVTNGGNYFGSTTGSLVRLADADGDGVAELQQTLVANVPGGRLTALRRAGPLLAVTGQGAGVPIAFYRLGINPGDPPAFLGQLDLTYPAGSWLHPHSALALREDPTSANRYELYFQLGSDANFAETTRSVALSGTLGLSATLAGDALHRVELLDGPGGLTAVGHTQIATGLRNASGIAFHPATGDLYLADNGIDGVVNVNEPTSADEINVVPKAALGSTVVDFGFPNSYEQYRTGVVVGGGGQLPLVSIQPLPPPSGVEAEGVNEIAFAPPLFPEPLAGGLFAGFHGRFNLAGAANEENPLALVDLDALSYFHFVSNDEPAVGHLDGLLATRDTLYVADISSHGGFSGAAQNTGRIYAITSLIPPGDYDRDGDADGSDLLHWQRDYGSIQPPLARSDGDGDGTVGAADLAVWSTHFGDTVAAAPQGVPEPRPWALLLPGAAALGVRRKR
ncbi:MAG: hypothetical protein DCC67_04460 [Planctomycetota bacterium]|nr:MAG: hypothetical protein DCC67_04460 [Planctomycetota bacterium]